MPDYDITSPQGQKFRVTAPDGATQDEVLAYAQQQFAQQPAQPTPEQAALAQQSPGYARQLPPVSGVQHFKDVMGTFARHPFTAAPGMLENGLSAVTGGVGAVADAVTFQDPGSHDWAYRPRTQAGQEIANLQGQEMAKAGQVYDRAAGTGPLAQTLKERVPEAAAAVSTVAPLARIGALRSPAVAPMTAEQVVSRLNSPQSMGAASAAPSLVNVSPELRQAIVRTAQKTGGAINPEVLARHVEADTLPVPVRLTEGQALQDPMVISHEMNTRGASKVMVEHLDQQNKQLAQNVQAIRDQVGPDVFSTNATEHGDALISAYRAKNNAAQTQVTAAYKALKDANGGQFPVDAKALLDNASAQLHQGLLYDHAPKAIMATLDRLATKGGMTFENFESLRTNLARIQRSLTADGNEKAAAGVIRDAMEQLPLAPEAAAMKPLADQARAAARAQFQALEADPAYKAAVTESVTPDRFVHRFVINGARDDVALMRQNLADNASATQTMGVAALDHLRDAARLNPHYEGNFAAASFNKGLQALSPKIQSLLPAEAADQLERLGSVSRYTTAQPKGSFVNNSNTTVASMADYGAKTAEHAVNATFHGLPVGSIGRKVIGGMTSNRAARQSIAPGAGLGRLQTSPQVQAMIDAAQRKAAQQMIP